MTLRDPAVDAVLTAETIFDQFKALLPELQSMMAGDATEAIGQAQALYPELWSAMDRARATLRDRGVDMPDYDELRARQPASMLGVDVNLRERSNATEMASTIAYLFGGVTGVVVSSALDVAGSLGAKQGEANRSGLADARAALNALRKAMPDVQWAKLRSQEAHAAADALEDLAIAKGRKLVLSLVVLAVLGLIGFGIIKLMQGSREPTAAERHEQEAQEFEDAQDEIRELNAVLKKTPCDEKAAERRASLFVKHGQERQGKRLAKKFIDQCGEHAAIRAIADAK